MAVGAGVEDSVEAEALARVSAVAAEVHARVLAVVVEVPVRALAVVAGAEPGRTWAAEEVDQVPAVATSRITRRRSAIRQAVVPRDPISVLVDLAEVIDPRPCRVTLVPVVAAPGPGSQA